MFKSLPAQEIEIAQIKILLKRKKIRNMHLRVTVPDAEVTVSAPSRYNIAQITEFVLQKIDWIKKSQNQIRKLRDEGKIALPHKFISGEIHEFLGKKFKLELIQNSSHNKLVLGDEMIQLYVKKLSNFKQRQKLFDDFYRANLKKIIPPLIEKYEQKMAVKVKEFGIKKMKTRWGTCNVRDHRIWLNLELAKKPPQYLESIVVHEMVHFFEHRHNKNFFALMDKFMPDWKSWS